MGCYNDDVLFIHIPKCGGTAAKHYINNNLPGVKWPRTATWFANADGRGVPNSDDKERASASVEEAKLPMGHVPLRDIPEHTGRSLDSWERIIGVIRNPYEQQVSQWLFWRDRYARGDNHPHDILAGQCPRIHHWLKHPECDFHIWYEQRFHPDEPLARKPPSAATGYEKWGGYYWYWLSVDGAIPDNVRVLRQEELDQSFPNALAPWMDGAPPPMKKRNVNPHADWFEYMRVSSTAFEIVNAKFRWCFDELKAYEKIVP